MGTERRGSSWCAQRRGGKFWCRGDVSSGGGGAGALSGSPVIKRRRVMDDCGREPNGRRTLPPVPRSVSSCSATKDPWKLFQRRLLSRRQA